MTKTKRRRQQEVKQRRFFVPALILSTIGWLILGLIVYQVPAEGANIFLFFLVLFFTLLFTSQLFLVNRLRVYLVSCYIVIMLLLRLFGIGNTLNALLLAGLFVAFDFLFKKTI